MINSIKDCTVLNNGVKMPWLGLGVFRVEEWEIQEAEACALENGYRSIDTAAIYANEQGVGSAIGKSGIPRQDIFITTKVWNSDQGYDNTLLAFEKSLKKLQTDYVDLYLIHWPVKEKYKQTWQALERIYKEGRARAIGVSNFLVHHLEDLAQSSTTIPTVNQVEFHPFLLQPKLLNYCKWHKIQLEAWSPLIKARYFDNAQLRAIAEKYNKTPAQVLLRWDLEHKVVTIPKSVHKKWIIENSEIFDFELTQEDMAIIDALDQNLRIGAHPDHFTF